MSAAKLKFDENGLIPAVIQDYNTKKVLTLAYMNTESLAITLSEKRTCFYSRSRNELWRKGETSGNTQQVVSVTADCDADALVVEVIKQGPACHNGTDSCFTDILYADAQARQFGIQALYDFLLSRKLEMPENSYTTYLFEHGKEKILKKIGEESSEVIIGAMKGSKEETVYEIADLCYHVLVLMLDMGITIDEIKNELNSRRTADKK